MNVYPALSVLALSFILLGNEKMKNVLITGCSSGIGLESALLLKQNGYHVLATVRNIDTAQPLSEQSIETIILDLNDSESIKKAVISAYDYFDGQLDALFNNAAYGQPGAVEDLDRDVLKQQFETNVFGTHELTRLVIERMRETNNSGRIIFNSSVLGFISMAYRGAYNASKYALEGLADTLRLELHDTDIKVSLIEPGPILSQFRANAFKQYQLNIDSENSAHHTTYQAMEKRLSKTEPAAPFTLPPRAVVDKLRHAIESPRPKIRYYVTFPTYLFAVLKRILPHRALDWFILKVCESEHR